MQDTTPYTPDQDDMPVLPPAIEEGFEDGFGDGGDKINPGDTPDEVPPGQPQEVPPGQTD